MTNFSATAANIWAVADMLRGDFKQSQYGRVILPFTLLRRLECVLEPTKDAVLDAAKKHAHMGEVGIRATEIPSTATSTSMCRWPEASLFMVPV